MQANPWEMNWGGDPVIAPPDPYKQADEGRKRQDQELDTIIKRQTIAANERDAAKAAVEDEAKADGPRERLARIKTSLANLRELEGMVRGSEMGVGSIVGQESFRSGDDFGGLSSYFNQRANDVSGSIEMVQGDLINQVRNEMQEQGAPIGAM